MIKTPEIFEAVRRGYSDLATATDEEILTYFNSTESPPSISTHIINIEEILLEQKHLDKLSELGISTTISKHPNLEIKLEKSSYSNPLKTKGIISPTNSESVVDDLIKALIIETLFPTFAVDYLLENIENI